MTSNERVLVTGGSGFIGTNLIEHYAAAGARLVNFDCQSPRNPAHERFWVRGNLLDSEQLRHVCRELQPQLVLHMAARTDLGGATKADYAANIQGVQNLVTVLSECAWVRRVLFGSSMLVCKLGHQPRDDTDYCPSTFYGESKVEGETIVRRTAASAAYSWTIIRPTSIWGPWFAAPYRSFFEAVCSRTYMHPKGDRTRRSYGFVLNSVAQIAAIADAPAARVDRATLYIADYLPLDVNSWAAAISDAFGVKPVREVPLALLRLFAACGDALQMINLPNVPLTSFRLRNLLTSSVLDLSKTREIVPDLPYALPEAVDITVSWLKQAVRASR